MLALLTTAGPRLRTLRRRSSSMLTHGEPPALITFDFTGTLAEPRFSVGSLYREVVCAAATAHGEAACQAAASLSAEGLTAAFKKAYGSATVARPCFGAGSPPMSSEEWWRGVVEATVTGAADGPEASAALRPVLPPAFAELFGETFVSEEGWRPMPHALETLRALSEYRSAQPEESRLRVGVLSNWDDRLPRLLEALCVTPHLDFVLTSRDAAVEKPDPAIFEEARRRAGVGPLARAVHIGDSFGTDVRGVAAASAAGASWEAVFVTPKEKLARLKVAERAALEVTTHRYCEDLSGLLELLGCV